MQANYKLKIDRDAELEVYNIAHGVFFPINGFISEKDYYNIVNDMHLVNGQPWTIPVTLDIPESEVDKISKEEEVELVNDDGDVIAAMLVESVFRVNYQNDIFRVFGTEDISHPGVKKEISRSPFRVGGSVKLIKEEAEITLPYTLTPEESRAKFKKLGWKTVAGFQTRNPIHRAHEYLQRLAMEMVDGIFIQPLIGWKKKGDISVEAIVASYEFMINKYYPKDKAVLGTLTTPMRYAGPREAVFHAIVRRNYGCTHFIVGRDHAGVGNYYRKYEAQDLCKQFNNLGIKILEFRGPYYCKICESIVTERTCSHGEGSALHVSGTEVRRLLSGGIHPPKEYMRDEIAEILVGLNKTGQLFIGGK